MTFNSHLSSKVDWCVEHELSAYNEFTFRDTHSAITRLTVITSFPKNAREPFPFHDVEELLNEIARLGASGFKKACVF